MTGMGVGAELGFTCDAEPCWAPAMLPLEAQQNVKNKTIGITRRMASVNMVQRNIRSFS
jgi:hypothetical protein